MSNPSLSQLIQYRGKIVLVKQIYAGNDYPISLSMKKTSPSSRFRGSLFQVRNIQVRKKAKRAMRKHRSWNLALTLKEIEALQSLLEVELQAPSCKVAGDIKQQQSLKEERLSYHWICGFPNSGYLTISLVLHLQYPSGQSALQIIDHKIKVVRLDSATQSELYWGTALFGILSFVSLAFALVVNWPHVLHVLGLQ